MKQQANFDNIELSIYEKFVLHSMAILHHERFYLPKTVDRLFRLGFIYRYKFTKSGTMYRRTPDGKMYFRIKRKGFIRFAIPTVISIISLLAAYNILWIKPLAEALQGLSRLLKNIMETLGVSPTMPF